MIINPYSPPLPVVNKEPARTQVAADASPENTVVQNRNIAPVPDVRVVQQTSESANSNALQDPKLDAEQDNESLESGGGHEPATQIPVSQRPVTQEKTGTSELLNEAELRQVQQLGERDREVRAHEQAHLSAAGSRATSGASFTYTDGPDGKRYATGGEVGVDTSPVRGDPEATLRAAELIQRAALAPASPSAQDRQVAAAANAMAQVASAELSQLRVEEARVAPEAEPLPVQRSSSVEGVADVQAVPLTVSDTRREAVSDVAVDTRDVQTQRRQQLLEDVFSAVQRGLDEDPRGANIDSFNLAVQTSDPLQTVHAIQSSIDRASVRSRQLGAEVSVAVPEIRSVVTSGTTEQEKQSTAVRDTRASSIAAELSVVSIKQTVSESDGSSETVQIEQRDEQVENRQQQLEDAFSAAAQGLGGEPEGTNLDYFL
ncbi:MAG: hypothetical protein L3J89_14025 [Gammaproteobacteria bacterium]|nr:hypothetical protein [Gammaproteobacteria bacterium]